MVKDGSRQNVLMNTRRGEKEGEQEGNVEEKCTEKVKIGCNIDLPFLITLPPAYSEETLGQNASVDPAYLN